MTFAWHRARLPLPGTLCKRPLMGPERLARNTTAMHQMKRVRDLRGQDILEQRIKVTL